MKIHRIASISFGGPVKYAFNICAEIGNVYIETSKITKDGEKIELCLVIASICTQESIILDQDNYIVVPETPRKACEYTIEILANMLSVFGRTKRTISSLAPSVAFSELSDEELKKLNSSEGIKENQRSNVSVPFKIDFSNQRFIAALADRHVGVALLAETLSSSHAVARYREFVRFFEHAFALPLPRLEKKLWQFLATSDLGYTRDEIKTWISLRHGATHADMLKTKILIFEPEIRPIIGRIEQAAYDVLFNKEVLQDSSKSRRNVLSLITSTKGRNGDIKMAQGAELSINIQVVDPFGVYPQNLIGGLTQIPEGWWCAPRASEKRLTWNILVVDPKEGLSGE